MLGCNTKKYYHYIITKTKNIDMVTFTKIQKGVYKYERTDSITGKHISGKIIYQPDDKELSRSEYPCPENFKTTVEQSNYLKTLKNKSGFIRKAIDEAIKNNKPKKEGITTEEMFNEILKDIK